MIDKAINIETAIWGNAIALLIDGGWKVIEKYDNFDAGIDYDHVVLEKDGERIEFFWDNWMEGEIKCSATRLQEIETMMGRFFEREQPKHL